jgi:hypothetical protein
MECVFSIGPNWEIRLGYSAAGTAIKNGWPKNHESRMRAIRNYGRRVLLERIAPRGLGTWSGKMAWTIPPRRGRFFVGRPSASRLFGGRPRAGSQRHLCGTYSATDLLAIWRIAASSTGTGCFFSSSKNDCDRTAFSVACCSFTKASAAPSRNARYGAGEDQICRR